MSTGPTHPIKLYRMDISGHCHRVELFLSLLGLPYELAEVDLRSGAHKQPDFLAKNPFGQIPVIDPAVALARANQLLQVMEQQLARQPFLAGERATLADIANYAYVAHAPEGNCTLEPYPAVRAWLARIEALPGFVPMVRSPVGLQA